MGLTHTNFIHSSFRVAFRDTANIQGQLYSGTVMQKPKISTTSATIGSIIIVLLGGILTLILVENGVTPLWSLSPIPVEVGLIACFFTGLCHMEILSLKITTYGKWKAPPALCGLNIKTIVKKEKLLYLIPLFRSCLFCLVYHLRRSPSGQC